MAPLSSHILAAVNFSDPLMLLGLLAGLIPIALHLFSRLRAPVVYVSTLRFLRETAQRTAQRRHIQQALLLLVRALAFALMGMAVALPLTASTQGPMAYGLLAALLIGAFLALWGGQSIRSLLGAKKPPSPRTAALTDVAKSPAPAEHRNLRWGLHTGNLLLGMVLIGGGIWGLASPGLLQAQGGTFDGRDLACVLVLDNSQSLAVDVSGSNRWQTSLRYARQLLTDVIKPAESGIVFTGREPAPLDRLGAGVTPSLLQLDQAALAGRVLPLSQQVQTARALLARSQRSQKMLVVISDYAQHSTDAAALASALNELGTTPCVLLNLGTNLPADVGIGRIRLASGHAIVGAEVQFDVQVSNNSDSPEVRKIGLIPQGATEPVVTTTLQIPSARLGGGQAQTRLSWRLPQAGLQSARICLLDAADAATWNDQRSIMLDVAPAVRALVLGDYARPQPRTSAYFVQAALAPYAGASTPTAWGINCTYAPLANMPDLSVYDVVMMSDIARPDAARPKLRSFVESGGRLCWILGPAVSAAAYSREDGLLPGPLDAPLQVKRGRRVTQVQTDHELVRELFDDNAVFREVAVTGVWTFGTPLTKDAQGILGLDQNIPLLWQHSLGRGRIYTLATALTGDWSNLGSSVVLVPMLARMAFGQSDVQQRFHTYEPYDTVTWKLPTVYKYADIKAPGQANPLRIRVENQVVTYPATVLPGTYTWQTQDDRQQNKLTGEFVVNPPGSEVALTSIDLLALHKELKSPQTLWQAQTPEDLRQRLDAQGASIQLTPGVLAFIVLFLLAEMLLANRHQPTVLRPADVKS